tara:strand:+ start:33411 stop:34787 length:1377 start_codon:yes stop_codon:yes gene_type:complete
MADKKKSILEEAILDAKRIQEALNANTKEILRSVAKEEIESLVKESLEEDYMEEDVEDDAEEIEAGAEDSEGGEEVEIDAIDGDDEAGEGVEVDGDIEGDIEGIEIDDSDVGDDLEGDYETGMDAVALDNEIEMDMTTASDDDIIAVYKKLTGDDEIEVVVDDEAGEVKLKVNEPGEFVIKMDGEGSDEDLDLGDMGGDADIDLSDIEGGVEPDVEVDDLEIDPVGDALDAEIEGPVEDNEDDDLGEAIYEIALEEAEDCEEGEKLEEAEDCEEGEEKLEEKIQVGKARTVANTLTKIKGAGGEANNVKAPNVTAVSESTTIKKYNALLTEAKELKGKNGEYKQALKQFRTMLAETVVFNSNLTYVTKLFMEHSTTKVEKEGIFKRFDDEVSTLKESKKLYKTLASQLGARKPMNESITNKFDKEVSSGVSKQLSESTVYVDKETSRIMDLMKRVDRK